MLRTNPSQRRRGRRASGGQDVRQSWELMDSTSAIRRSAQREQPVSGSGTSSSATEGSCRGRHRHGGLSDVAPNHHHWCEPSSSLGCVADVRPRHPQTGQMATCQGLLPGVRACRTRSTIPLYRRLPATGARTSALDPALASASVLPRWTDADLYGRLLPPGMEYASDRCSAAARA